MIDRHAVQALIQSGLSTKEIAQQMGISTRSVQRIAKGWYDDPPAPLAARARRGGPALNVEDLALRRGKVRLRKAKGNKAAQIGLLPETVARLEAWLVVRGSELGPLWVSLRKGGRLDRHTRVSLESTADSTASTGEFRRLSERGFAKMLAERLLSLGFDPASPLPLAAGALRRVITPGLSRSPELRARPDVRHPHPERSLAAGHLLAPRVWKTVPCAGPFSGVA